MERIEKLETLTTIDEYIKYYKDRIDERDGVMNLVLDCSFNQLEKLTTTILIYLTDVLKG